ncbi:hypothetical protein L596_028115 [Steinernema carpocapsae]|uniref:Uncharacterized protein n=1 Tax=Steinernema carpocapsae TaxID=34508 RepID=A0A4U5LXG8_STECR|nr:hypothetical protein L596_028115 [Steinernema carpocapsae]
MAIWPSPRPSAMFSPMKKARFLKRSLLMRPATQGWIFFLNSATSDSVLPLFCMCSTTFFIKPFAYDLNVAKS